MTEEPTFKRKNLADLQINTVKTKERIVNQSQNKRDKLNVSNSIISANTSILDKERVRGGHAKRSLD